MIITMPNLEITNEDNEAILGLYRSTLRSKGYKGFVAVNANRLYEIHKQTSKQIARSWIKICYHQSKK